MWKCSSNILCKLLILVYFSKYFNLKKNAWVLPLSQHEPPIFQQWEHYDYNLGFRHKPNKQIPRSFGQWLCGSVGRAVASDTRGPRFGSNPVIGKKLLNIWLLSTVYWKDEIEKKRPGMAHFFKKQTNTKKYGRLTWLSGSVISYHPVAPGSNPMHNIYALIFPF